MLLVVIGTSYGISTARFPPSSSTSTQSAPDLFTASRSQTLIQCLSSSSNCQNTMSVVSVHGTARGCQELLMSAEKKKMSRYWTSATSSPATTNRRNDSSTFEIITILKQPPSNFHIYSSSTPGGARFTQMHITETSRFHSVANRGIEVQPNVSRAFLTTVEIT